MVTRFTGYVEVEGAVRYKQVTGSYQIFKEASGLTSWRGSLEIISGELPSLYEGILYMDDGKKGKILITNISLPSSQVQFQGSGPIT